MKNSSSLLLNIGFLFSASLAQATLHFPSNMTQNDRQEALRIFGLGTSQKILSDPVPLGGFSGFEMGVSVESLPVGELGSLGSGISSAQQDATFTKVTLGKGLYNDLDIFISFTPDAAQKSEISEYGGMMRWSFYRGIEWPVGFAVLGQLSGVNVEDQLTAQSLGVDFVSNLYVQNAALSVGIGPATTQGYFIGGTDGVTDSQNSQTERVSSLHAFLAASVRLREAFVAFQVDRYTQTILSAKLGLRF